jgi:hypothetical protein
VQSEHGRNQTHVEKPSLKIGISEFKLPLSIRKQSNSILRGAGAATLVAE